MFHFLELPREIRDMIYTLALYRGRIEPHRRKLKPPRKGVMSPRFTGCNNQDEDNPPNLALLALNTKIRNEALSIYLGSNLVVITENANNRRWRDRELISCFLTAQRVPHIRRLQVGFSRFEMSGQTREYANDGAVSVLRLLAGTQEVTAATRQELHHDGRKSMLHATWHVKVQDLVTSGLRLDYLIVDLENSHCPDRCCRDAFETRLFPLVQALVDGSQEKVDFVGVTDAEEEARIRSVIWANT